MTSSSGPRPLELLAPAANAAIAVEAIKHGADAVYIGPPSHGARNAAANSFEDIEQVVRFAHIFGAKVYVTVNTLIKESELKEVERMIRRLYLIGVDALIIQDMAILRMDIPPIPLHASTQCDIRTPGKARFLEEVGFSQLVLARELSLAEIEAICKSVTIPVETFVHGALCVSYSGRCAMGQICASRSGNRGV
ncbi:MAG: U32 family peptidase, partial [Muribaculaceae bacterium]|nr:U32 family peptidase [Muribaculaceae bacterium]